MLLEPNYKLTPRNKNVREKCPSKTVMKFSLKEIKQHFDESLAMLRNQTSIAHGFYENRNVEEAKYIWRTQIVLLESAYDFYLHEITKYGLCRIYEKQWDETPKYKNININMETLSEALISNGSLDWFLKFTNDHYSIKTLTSYQSFRDQCNLLGIDYREIADEVFYDRNSRKSTEEKLENVITELFKRRNRIAHQYDCEYADAEPQNIDEKTVEDFLQRISEIVDSIYRAVLRKDGIFNDFTCNDK